ncbi:hypothetical protein PV10_06814 [Exophiala mesophila]|uniref:Thioredoxin domain-containing protein n=1 Tax=Exophiala mesophila TaxID=212818 RepID=A0A0D1Z3Q5_EXOME|nr:uncharacterized protein PV10_06814 [Exophiala mesophila]KIV89407.1 hypothetical protein PV10_06814 [Exophiala mesophila]
MATQTKVVSRTEYLAQRLRLLDLEKAHTRQSDELAKLRRELPVVQVLEQYTFTTLDGAGNKITVALDDLFDGRPQLIIYHFMFDPEADAACPSCTLFGDHIPPLQHLNSHNTSFAAVSRAPMDKIQSYKDRLGFTFPWLSSHGSSFNYDFNVTTDPAIKPVSYNFLDEDQLKQRNIHQFFGKGEQPGTSVFIKGGFGIGEEGKIYHTYSTYARGGEKQIGTLLWLDLTLLGRQDQRTDGLGYKRRDEYTPQDLRPTASVTFI